MEGLVELGDPGLGGAPGRDSLGYNLCSPTSRSPSLPTHPTYSHGFLSPGYTFRCPVASTLSPCPLSELL